MSLEYAILGYLSEQPSTGYDIKNRCFSGSVGAFWQADQAQIYRTLDKLSKKQWVTSKRQRQDGRPDRIVYSISPEGTGALHAWLLDSAQPHHIKDPFALRVHFAESLSVTELMALFTHQRDQHLVRLAHLHHELEQTQSSDKRPSKSELVRAEALKGVIAKEQGAAESLESSLKVLRAFGDGGS